MLLPADYSETRRYPVLLLLHGCCDDYRSWVDKGRAEQLSAPYPLIVVMPDGGSAGWYSDPYAGGPPRYETYAFNELLPWVDATFRTTGGRAVAGLSMGGFGALKYAARHPGVFQAAASYSGVMDAPSFAANGYANLIPDTVWGPRATDLARWSEHNPLDLAERLRGLKLLELRTGNGQPGPLDTRTSRDNLEYEVWRGERRAAREARRARHPARLRRLGPGVHDWPYWARGLEQTLMQPGAVFPDTADSRRWAAPCQRPAAERRRPGRRSAHSCRAWSGRTRRRAGGRDLHRRRRDAERVGSGRLANSTLELPEPLQVERGRGRLDQPQSRAAQ